MPSYKNKKKGASAEEEQKTEMSVSQKYEQKKKAGAQKKGLKKPESKLRGPKASH